MSTLPKNLDDYQNKLAFLLGLGEEENDETNNAEYEGDPCYEYAFSVIFFILLILFFSFVSMYWYLTWKRLKRTTLAGFEVLCNLLLIFAAIRFGPKIWGALQIFGIQHASQSGCKLVAYTEYGIRHVEIVVLSLLVLYVWLAMRRQYDLDDKIRSNLAWLLLSLLAIEGVTGMVPAMYTDIGFVGSQYQCDFGEPNEGNDGHYVVMEMLFSTLLPYVIPSIVLLYPLLKLTRLHLDVNDEPLKSRIKCVLILAWTRIGRDGHKRIWEQT